MVRKERTRRIDDKMPRDILSLVALLAVLIEFAWLNSQLRARARSGCRAEDRTRGFGDRTTRRATPPKALFPPRPRPAAAAPVALDDYTGLYKLSSRKPLSIETSWGENFTPEKGQLIEYEVENASFLGDHQRAQRQVDEDRADGRYGVPCIERLSDFGCPRGQSAFGEALPVHGCCSLAEGGDSLRGAFPDGNDKDADRG